MLPERIERRIDKDGPSGCWLWTGPVHMNGYSYTRWRRKDGTWGHARVHRLVYEDVVGPIADGLEIDHICQVRRCVNPQHLRTVTHATNLETRNHRGPARVDVCRHGHDLSDPANLYVSPKGRRGCRPCRTANVKRWRARSTQ